MRRCPIAPATDSTSQAYGLRIPNFTRKATAYQPASEFLQKKLSETILFLPLASIVFYMRLHMLFYSEFLGIGDLGTVLDLAVASFDVGSASQLAY
ncbi:hypothetical protein EVG20_g9460 [Dentipellis fragilis]|uniref:Uncharacterized protein n=1 Tax=Dentipellis fragilis TaxID=205917 RepID=A0A4Y9Y0Y7_9AGAM|nr:hypothetical protein EVG20_g9460 [Dentipellis fragilis]